MIKLYCLFCFLIIPVCLFSQQKYYIPSANDYYEVTFTNDVNDRINGYFGSYELIYPGYDENGIPEGDSYSHRIHFSINDDSLSVYIVALSGVTNYKDSIYPAFNVSLQENLIKFNVYGVDYLDSVYSGKFVIGKYIDKNGKEKNISGLLIKNNSYTDMEIYSYFYEKIVK
jgi:hypothetical protein